MIYVILGTKAQLIKMAPVMALLQNRNIPYRFIFTGQHRETIEDLQENFGLKKPDVTLYDGRDIVSVVQMFVWSLGILKTALLKRQQLFSGPGGIVLVHGDTLSTLLGAIIGKLGGQKVAHVESGLRSFNIFHPFPEELTRICTFYLADYYFCSGLWAVDNLKKFNGSKINTQYNTLLDALRLVQQQKSKATVQIPQDKFCIVTMHRFENLRSKDILNQNLNLIEQVAKDCRLIFILHPVTQKKLIQYGSLDRLKNNPRVELRPRYDYLNFMHLLESAEFLVSDGGSNQEECFYLGKPCVLLRKATERQEGLGTNVVISNYDANVIGSFLKDYQKRRHGGLDSSVSPSKIIVDEISTFA